MFGNCKKHVTWSERRRASEIVVRVRSLRGSQHEAAKTLGIRSIYATLIQHMTKRGLKEMDYIAPPSAIVSVLKWADENKNSLE